MENRITQILEFDKIKQMLSAETASGIGSELAEKLSPADSKVNAERLLSYTETAESIVSSCGGSPVSSFPDIRNTLIKIHATLAFTPSELLQCAQCLRVSREVKRAIFSEENTVLSSFEEKLISYKTIEDEIARCILSEDEIADNASPELSRIRRQMRIINERMRDRLNDMIKNPNLQKYLQDAIITVRNGHLVIPVKAEHRAQFPGIIQDASGSGATLFVEPSANVEMSNEFRKLEVGERAEIERILAGLTSLIEPIAEQLIESIGTLGELDLIFAKAVLSKKMGAVLPKINDNGYTNIINGRHPLLNVKKVVPVSVWVGREFRTLIITGPNTGGKTVALKTVGLLSVMAACGLFVPADFGTELSVYDNIYADIGDEQSIEQSLSTFSSHMKNIVRILEEATEKSLILLDELGAGTDPVEGAALAQAILLDLHERGTCTLATTHYSEIKAFALVRDGMQNACMEFDVEKLCPTYRLYIGIPGKSNAFEISERLGIKKDVIENAKTFLTVKDVSFEDVLERVENARKKAFEAREEAVLNNKKVFELKQELEKEKETLKKEKTQLRQKAKEDAKKIVRTTRAELEELIASLRSFPDLDQKALERAIQNTRDSIRKTENNLYEYSESVVPNENVPENLLPGQEVHILSVDKDAVVLKEKDNKGEILVQCGIIKMKVPASDLCYVRKTQKPKVKTGVKLTLHESERSFLELDLRGKMVDDACIEIDRFIDDARISGISQISIIHGKGTGALRTGVQNYLKRHPAVKSFRQGAYGEGDAGVTVVVLK